MGSVLSKNTCGWTQKALFPATFPCSHVSCTLFVRVLTGQDILLLPSQMLWGCTGTRSCAFEEGQACLLRVSLASCPPLSTHTHMYTCTRLHCNLADISQAPPLLPGWSYPSHELANLRKQLAPNQSFLITRRTVQRKQHELARGVCPCCPCNHQTSINPCQRVGVEKLNFISR